MIVMRKAGSCMCQPCYAMVYGAVVRRNGDGGPCLSPYVAGYLCFKHCSEQEQILSDNFGPTMWDCVDWVVQSG